MNKDELRRAIVGVCSDWVSLDFIATSVNKNVDYLLAKIIPSMLAEGIIERMFPKTPRHPNQKYKRSE